VVRIYKCPGCGSEMIYDAGTDRLICPHCGQTRAIDEVEAQEASGYSTGLIGQETADNAGDGMKEYKCPGCGASIVTDEFTAATFCSFCGSPTLIESRVDGKFRPSRILPFKFDKKAAQEKFKTWTGTGFLTPASFKSQAVMDKVSGIYVPYWLYSYDARVDIAADCTREFSQREGNLETITTEHYRVNHTTHGRYENVPYDASEKMPDESMAVLEPFDYSDLRDFKLPYLSGYMAEKYQYSADELGETVRSELAPDVLNASVGTIRGYASVNVIDSDVKFLNETAEYVMCPVWTLNFKYGGKNYPLYMNGQDGKIDGVLPRSKGKTFLLFAGAFTVCFLLSLLMGGIF